MIKNVELAKEKDDANFFELSTMLQDAFAQCMEDAKPVLLEPIYNLMINSPENHIGTVTSLINQFQGKILKITQFLWIMRKGIYGYYCQFYCHLVWGRISEGPY